MNKKKHVEERIDLITLMRKKGISTHTRMSFMWHVALLDTREEGDIIVKESREMIENGATEQEFITFLQDKYGVKHVLDMTEEELEEIHKAISKKSKALNERSNSNGNINTSTTTSN